MIIEFYSFTMPGINDVDVDICVAEPIWKWQQTEQGQWAMTNSKDLMYYTSTDHDTLGYHVSIRGEIKNGPELTEYLLKYGK